MNTILKKTGFLILIMFIYCDMYSQINLNVKASASNFLRYGVGKENFIGGSVSKKYFEELADVRLLINELLIGVRYEYDDPIEYGKSVKGISRRFVEFKKEDFTARAGNYYELFVRGLVLNSFESRPIGWNTEFDGVKINYKHNFGNENKPVRFNGTILGGGINFTDILDTARTETYSVRATNFSVSPIKLLTFGGSYLYTNGRIPTAGITTNITAELFEGDLGISYGGFDLFANYATKKTSLEANAIYPQSKSAEGDGCYGSLAYTTEGLGVTLEYKNYRFNIVTPNQRSDTDPFKPLPFQNPPTAIREYSSVLLSRFPHKVDFGDEVGYQIEVYYSPNDKLFLNANASLSSRHYDYRDIDSSNLTRYERIERNNSFLPSLQDPYSPYWEAFFEAEYYWNEYLKTKLGIARKFGVLYSIVSPQNSERTRTLTIPLEIQYTFEKIYSIKLNTEFQTVYNSLRAGEKDYINQFTSISLSRSPNIIVTGNFEITNDDEDPSGKKFWTKGEITYKFSPSNIIIVSYGSERGGIQCSSGICRYINPFNGFRLSLINNFN